MEWWKALILGLVQGFTEFLPVSSSGHLVLVQSWLNIESASNMLFDILLHLATLVAVCAVLYKEIWQLFKHIISKPVLLLIIATIPAGLAGLFLNDFFSEFFEGTKYLWIFFMLSAIVLFVSDMLGAYYEKKKMTNQPQVATTADGDATKVINKPLFTTITYPNAIAMGLAQACAIFPGLTRSGSTIAAGIVTKGNRSEVARFSFIMSIPIILASALMETVSVVKDGIPVDIPALSIVLGMVAACVSGYIAVKWMLRLVEKCSLKWFSLYLIAMAVLVFVNNYTHMW